MVDSSSLSDAQVLGDGGEEPLGVLDLGPVADAPERDHLGVGDGPVVGVDTALRGDQVVVAPHEQRRELADALQVVAAGWG